MHMNTDQLASKYRHISREAAPPNKLTYDGLTGRMASAAYVAHNLDTLHMTLQEARNDALVQAERRERMAARPDEPQDYREYCADFAQVLREFIADADADE
jgi:hypothetical protein